MNDTMIATHLENLDRRLAKVEQVLPTLATKDDLRTLATKDELKALATKAELAAAIAPLATKAELRAAIAEAVAPLATKDDVAELRRHMNVLNESLRGDIHMIAAHVASEKLKDPEP